MGAACSTARARLEFGGCPGPRDARPATQPRATPKDGPFLMLNDPTGA